MPENFEQRPSGLWLPKEEPGHKISPEEMEKRREIIKEARETGEKIMKEKQKAEERRKKQEAWLETPLRGTRVRERIKDAEKASEPSKPEGVVEPAKAAEPEREKLMKTELDPEWVLGKERAKLAKELGERIRAKSTEEEIKAGKKVDESARTEFETKEGEKFSTERLIDPEDPRVNKVQETLEMYFKSEEVDPIEVLKQAMTGKMATGEKVPPYLVHVAENSKGEIEGVHTGAVCEMVDKKGNVSKKSAVSLGFYTVVSPEMREKGVWKNLFKAFEKSAAKDAKDRGLKVKGYMGEAHDGIEEPLNKQGVKRAYIKADGVFFEVPYEQPPVDWDQETGKPAEGAGIVPEHLMLKLTSGKDKVSGKELMEMVRGMYDYNNYREEKYFKNEKAYNDHTKFVKSVEQKLADFVMGKTAHLLSAKDREAMKKKGVQFSEQELTK